MTGIVIPISFLYDNKGCIENRKISVVKVW